MSNQKTLSTALVAVTPISLFESDPAFDGCTIKPVTMAHPDDDDYDPNHIRGAHVTFTNGMVFSIQWGGRSSYSNVGRGWWKPGDEIEFETAAWYPGAYCWENGLDYFCPELDGPYDRDRARAVGVYDQVQAYQTVEQVLATARIVAKHVPPMVVLPAPPALLTE